MLRLLLPLTVAVIFSCGLLTVGSSAPGEQIPRANTIHLEGAFEFVSETTVLTRPKPLTRRIAAPDWQGLWVFTGDRFSQTLMKRERLYSTYPKFQQEMGYYSFAGTYIIDRDTVRLKMQMALHPLSVGRSLALSYQLEGDTLTLTENLDPYPEDLSQGHRITVLRRLKDFSPTPHIEGE